MNWNAANSSGCAVRPDLGITPQKYEGKTYYVVKDPVSLRYYRFKEQEYFVFQLFDGKHTLEDAQKDFEREFRPHRLTFEDLEAFAQQLLTAGLVQHETAAGRQARCSTSARKQRRLQWIATLTNILYIKIPVFDPDDPDVDASVPVLDLHVRGSLLPSVALMAVGGPARADALRDVLRQAARRTTSSSSWNTLLVHVDRAGRREGHPRVRPRAFVQGVRRRMSRDGRAVHVLLAVPVLQRLRRVDACRTSGSGSSSASPASTSSW